MTIVGIKEVENVGAADDGKADVTVNVGFTVGGGTVGNEEDGI